jgi:hypothetical protein
MSNASVTAGSPKHNHKLALRNGIVLALRFTPGLGANGLQAPTHSSPRVDVRQLVQRGLAK